MTPEEARDLRELIGISQHQLARRLEVHPPFGGVRSYNIHTETISRYERGKFPIPQWYSDVLHYLMAHEIGDDERMVVTFPTTITKCHVPAKEKVQW